VPIETHTRAPPGTEVTKGGLKRRRSGHNHILEKKSSKAISTATTIHSSDEATLFLGVR